MKKVTLFVFMGLLVISTLPLAALQAQPAGAAPTVLEKPILNCERQVASWAMTKEIEIAYIAVMAVIGVLIAVLQRSTEKNKAARWLTFALGLVLGILTGINGTGILFPADVKALRRAEFDGRAIIDQLWIKVRAAEDPQASNEDRKAATKEYLDTLNRFYAVGDALTAAPHAAVSLPSTVPVVYAQSPNSLPAWTQQKPDDTATARYVVAKASDPSLAVAKQNSAGEAVYEATVALIPAAPNASRDALLDLVRASAVTQDTAFAYNANTRNYDFYTLLRLTPDIQDLVKTLPQAAAPSLTKFQRKGWLPTDLASDPTSGLFALDHFGGVSRLDLGQRGTGRIERLFEIARFESGYALAASADSVFVAAGSKFGCKVYKYSLQTRTATSRMMAMNERCVGIATDGTAVYLTMPESKEIRYWDGWDTPKYRSWPLARLGAPGFLEFDRAAHRLIIVDDTQGTAYAVSIPDGKAQLLSEKLGAVQSIAVSRFHVLFASGRKVLFLARSDNHGENPPLGWPPLQGGHIVGVAVDGADQLWVADYDNEVVQGPLPLI